jgi:hypothetical protein
VGLFRHHTTAGPPPPAPPASTAWKELPVVSRLTGDLEPTIDTRFDRQLATWQSPAVTRLLDHGVRSDGPSGTVVRPPVRPARAVFMPSVQLTVDVDTPAPVSPPTVDVQDHVPAGSSRQGGAETARSPDENEGVPAIAVEGPRPVGLGPPLTRAADPPPTLTRPGNPSPPLTRPADPSPPALQRSAVMPPTVVAPPSVTTLPIDGGTASTIGRPPEPAPASAVTPVEPETATDTDAWPDDIVNMPPTTSAPTPVEPVTVEATRPDEIVAATVQRLRRLRQGQRLGPPGSARRSNARHRTRPHHRRRHRPRRLPRHRPPNPPM